MELHHPPFAQEHAPLFQHLTRRRGPESRAQALRSLAVSVLVHAAILALAVLAGRKAGYALLEDLGTPGGISAGPAGGGGGGGSGEQVTYLEIAPAAPPAPDQVTLTVPEVAPPPEPEPEPEPVTPPTPAPTPPTPAPPAPAAGAQTGAGAPTAGTGTGTGTGQGEGTGSGTGPGSGGGSGGGTGGGIGSGVGPGTGAGRMQPPIPEFVLIPPSNPPRAVRGDSLVVRLNIDEGGKVRDVEFRSTGDRGYDQKLRRTALEWRFRPARGPDNRPIRVAYDVTLQF